MAYFWRVVRDLLDSTSTESEAHMVSGRSEVTVHDPNTHDRVNSSRRHPKSLTEILKSQRPIITPRRPPSDMNKTRQRSRLLERKA
jgi:hypothetical protein